ncbi:MAG: zinc ribbon domain-containing protein [Pseudomonadota bacterium]
MSQIACPKCAKRVPSEARFCTFCGWKLSTPVTADLRLKFAEQQEAAAAREREKEQNKVNLRQLQADNRHYACSLCGAHNPVRLFNSCNTCRTRQSDSYDDLQKQLVEPKGVRPIRRYLKGLNRCQSCSTSLTPGAMLGVWIETEYRYGGGPQKDIFEAPDWAQPDTLSFAPPGMVIHDACHRALRRKRDQEKPAVSNSESQPPVDLKETLLMERATHLWDEMVAILYPDPDLFFLKRDVAVRAIYIKPCPKCSERDVFGLEKYLGDATQYLRPAKWHGRTLKRQTKS